MDWPIAFSSFSRKAYLEQLADEEWDLLVVGGGITGAGIALDAALRGLKVALVEKQDFAAGTSGRSTKLVHGGLRYLKSGELGLVRALGRERSVLFRNAAHLVSPQKMMLPFAKGALLMRYGIAAGLWLYDSLAKVPYAERRLMLSADELKEKEPVLLDTNVGFGARIYEYVTDDARLVLSVLQKACEHGARPINYTKLQSFSYDDGKVSGATVVDLRTDKAYQIRAKVVVNASGAWTDGLCLIDDAAHAKRLHLSKGVHLVVQHKRFPIQHALYFNAVDSRKIFAVPKWDKVYIGTTDTDYEGALEHPQVTQDDVLYILKAVNDLMPQLKLGVADVLASWAGFRSLIGKPGKRSGQLSRKELVLTSQSGLITVAGGKLTGYRLMAKSITDMVCHRLPEFRDVACCTHQVALYGGEFGFELSAASVEQFGEGKFFEARSTGIAYEDFIRLFYRYGTKIDAVTELAYDLFNEYRTADEAWLRAEVTYAIEQEMALTVDDFLLRRTGLALFDPAKADALRIKLTELFAELVVG